MRTEGRVGEGIVLLGGVGAAKEGACREPESAEHQTPARTRTSAHFPIRANASGTPNQGLDTPIHPSTCPSIVLSPRILDTPFLSIRCLDLRRNLRW